MKKFLIISLLAAFIFSPFSASAQVTNDDLQTQMVEMQKQLIALYTELLNQLMAQLATLQSQQEQTNQTVQQIQQQTQSTQPISSVEQPSALITPQSVYDQRVNTTCYDIAHGKTTSLGAGVGGVRIFTENGVFGNQQVIDWNYSSRTPVEQEAFNKADGRIDATIRQNIQNQLNNQPLTDNYCYGYNTDAERYACQIVKNEEQPYIDCMLGQ